ncbi:MAG: hypothetical protein K5871_04590 [Lachnospiraceae bacterium]|nr:hypothetical protein [Lachnospiraceae bacterium]
MKESIGTVIASIICILILVIPLPAGALYLRFHIKDAGAGDYKLYYTTDGSQAFCEEQCIEGSLNSSGDEVTFRIDGTLEEKITGMRFDLPPTDQMVVLDSVSASSAGMVKDRWSVTDIFAPENLSMTNSAEVQVVPSRELAYISTSADDPYVIFAPNIVGELTGLFSHKFITKIVIVLLIVAGMIFAKLNLFEVRDGSERT